MYDSRMQHEWDKNAFNYAVQEAAQEAKRETLMEIAYRLKKEGLSLELITKTTSLSVEDIEKL